MARSRRPRGFGPDLRGTLGTLVRSTLAQAGVVRDVLERGAREGRARLDDVRRDRRREAALAELGEAVMEALRAGELAELFEVPAIATAIAEVEALERDEADTADELPAKSWAPTQRGARYDRDEAPRARERPAPAPAARRDRSDEPGARFRVDERADDDGTVSSASWRPPPRAAAEPARAGKPAPARPAAPRPGTAPPRGDRPERADRSAPAPAAPRAGGIKFGADEDDDDDLARYMHPDDVPAKGPRGGDGS